ncbi:MAG: GNAT family N-acetyltransferase [Actinomycetia bacterium]|nr:GNAT family N-acetyltransferase [Actinomycetes bacterium]
MARIILRDGRVAELREIRNDPADAERLRRLFARVSRDTLYYRFFQVVREVRPEIIRRLLQSDGKTALALVTEVGDEFAGIGNYIRLGDSDTAEVAFLVDDRYQGLGIGTLLLEHLAYHAWRHGLKRFEAYVLADNKRMLGVFQHSGYELTRHWDADHLRLVLPLHETERVRALAAVREKLATAASLAPFFQPATVAVVGASRDPNRLGHLLLRHLLGGEFTGVVYPVNPEARSVAAVRAYPSLRSVPERVDLAVLAVPAAQVPLVVEDCVAAEVRAVLITSSGFADAGPEGLARQQQVVARLRGAGIRLVGPNSLGLLSTHPAVRLNASFAPRLPRAGPLAIASQSGALGVAILDYAERIGLGVSGFVSLGNKADVSGNDLLQYWEDDPQTRMIALHLESFGNPRKFWRIASRITAHKPVLVVKSARTTAGQEVSEARAAALQVDDAIVDALFHQSGIIRADTLQDLFDVAALLGGCPLPGGRRVAVLTNTAGGAVMAVDALRSAGLVLARPPVDLGFEGLAQGYRQALPALLQDPDVDAVVVLFTPVGHPSESEVAEAVRAAVAEVLGDPPRPERMKPVVANFLLPLSGAPIGTIEAGPFRLPVYPFPERAVLALARAVRYAEYRARPRGRLADLPPEDFDALRALAEAAHAERRAHGTPEEVDRLLAAMDCRPAARPARRALALRVTTDPLFGPVLTLAAADSHGDGPERTRPELARLVPLTDRDAAELAEAVRARGGALADLARQGLETVLLKCSRLVDEVWAIRTLDVPWLWADATGWQAAEASVVWDAGDPASPGPTGP